MAKVIISEFQLSEYPVADGLFSCRIGGAFVLTHAGTQKMLEQKLNTGEWKLTPTKSGNSLFAGPVSNVDIEVLKPFLGVKRTLASQLALLTPAELEAELA